MNRYSTYNSSGLRYIGGLPYAQYSGTTSSGWMEETMSLRHPHWRFRKGRARNIGGPFFSRKVRLVTDFPSSLQLSTTATPNSGYRHEGFVAPPAVFKEMQAIHAGKPLDSDTWSSDRALSRSELRALGLNLLLKATPTTPAYSMANALGELVSERAFFSIPKIGEPTPGSVSGDYLNLQFAILPLISDEAELRKIARESDEIIKQFRRDSGRRVKRRRAEETVVSTSTTTYTSGGDVQVQTGTGTVLATALRRSPKLTITQKITRDIWFSGVWEYYVPPTAERFLSFIAEKNRLYGFIPTPQTVWELTPFSWLVDWFVNVDDLLRQTFIAGTDGSVPVRAYVMAKSIIVTEYTWTAELPFAGSWRPRTFTYVVEETIKQRERAGGFGLDWREEGLSPKQLSILAALGVSRFSD